MWAANKQIVFDGDGYSEAWHKEAEKRGLANLKTTPDALPWLVEKSTVAAFKKYKVLSKRELESRYEVFTEQYVMNINIEAETEAAIGRTMVLPASVRYLNELQDSGLEELVARDRAGRQGAALRRRSSSRTRTSTRTTRSAPRRRRSTCATR